MIPYEIREDDLTGEAIIALLRFHRDEMVRNSPPCSIHSFTVERLREPDVTFFAAWDGETLAACGALKQLDEAHGELKAMRAALEYRGKGAGKAMLLHLMAEARRREYTRLSLETGRPEPFHAAQGLYRKHGFVECAPFGDYTEDPFSLCMTRKVYA